MANQKHLIGLLLGAEEDWPTALEALVKFNMVNRMSFLPVVAKKKAGN